MVKQFSCDICDYKSNRQNHLNFHLKITHKEKEKKYKCDHCVYSTKRQEHLSLHVENVHQNAKKFKCKEEGCPFTANQNHNLRQHIRTVHLQIKKFECEMCGYRAARSRQVLNHKEKTHPNFASNSKTQANAFEANDEIVQVEEKVNNDWLNFLTGMETSKR